MGLSSRTGESASWANSSIKGRGIRPQNNKVGVAGKNEYSLATRIEAISSRFLPLGFQMVGAILTACFGCLVSYEERARRIPAIFQPDYFVSSSRRSRAATGARIKAFARVLGDNTSRQANSVDIALLAGVGPRIAEVQALLESQLVEFSALVGSRPGYPVFAPYNAPLGRLAIYGPLFAAMQKDGTWFFSGILTLPIDQVWPHILKAFALFHSFDYLTRVSLPKRKREICASLSLQGLDTPQALRWWEACEDEEISGFDKIMTQASTEELLVVLHSPGSHVLFLREFFSGQVWLDVDLERIRNIPVELDPLRKFVCVKLQLKNVCENFINKYEILVAEIPEFEVRLDSLRQNLVAAERGRTNGNFVFVIEARSSNENLIPLFHRLCWDATLRDWPGLERLLWANTSDAFQEELAIMNHADFRKFVQVVVDELKRNQGLTPADLRATLTAWQFEPDLLDERSYDYMWEEWSTDESAWSRAVSEFYWSAIIAVPPRTFTLSSPEVCCICLTESAERVAVCRNHHSVCVPCHGRFDAHPQARRAGCPECRAPLLT